MVRGASEEGVGMDAGSALAGLRVVEFAHVIAGPLAGTLLADLGAEVVHVEDPRRGDPQRFAGPAKDGAHLWWKVAARNKRSVTLDLRSEEGRAIAHELAAWADVAILNFKASTLERWGLDWSALHEVNPKLIVLQVSGFGANTIRRDRPGFGKVGEAMSGVVHLTGFPEETPVHTGFSHGDSVTGLMGAFAIQAALYRRANDDDFRGEWIDLALYEGLFRLIEWQVIFRDQLGVAPMRAGNKLAAAPAAVINTYKTQDGHWMTVTSGTPRSVSNVAGLVGEPAEDYITSQDQEARQERLDKLVAEWVADRPLDECLEVMDRLDVVASKIYTVDDILEDPTYKERENVVEVEDQDLGPLRMQGVIPKLQNYPGAVWSSAPSLGEANELVYGDYLGKSPDEIRRLQVAGTI